MDREALIRELRAQVGSLEAASGLSITTLSPVSKTSARTPAARPARPDPARRLALPSSGTEARADASQGQSQLSGIAAAPRTDGRHLPSGRVAGASADSSAAHVSATDQDPLHLSFETADHGNSSRGDALAPFIATKCLPTSSTEGQSGDDIEVPAPRAPPRPMEQLGSAHPSPAKVGGAGESVRSSLRSVRESLSDKSVDLLKEAGVGVWEGGWGLGGTGAEPDAADASLQSAGGAVGERVTEAIRALGRLSTAPSHACKAEGHGLESSASGVKTALESSQASQQVRGHGEEGVAVERTESGCVRLGGAGSAQDTAEVRRKVVSVGRVQLLKLQLA